MSRNNRRTCFVKRRRKVRVNTQNQVREYYEEEYAQAGISSDSSNSDDVEVIPRAVIPKAGPSSRSGPPIRQVQARSWFQDATFPEGEDRAEDTESTGSPTASPTSASMPPAYDERRKKSSASGQFGTQAGDDDDDSPDVPPDTGQQQYSYASAKDYSQDYDEERYSLYSYDTLGYYYGEPRERHSSPQTTPPISRPGTPFYQEDDEYNAEIAAIFAAQAETAEYGGSGPPNAPPASPELGYANIRPYKLNAASSFARPSTASPLSARTASPEAEEMELTSHGYLTVDNTLTTYSGVFATEDDIHTAVEYVTAEYDDEPSSDDDEIPTAKETSSETFITDEEDPHTSIEYVPVEPSRDEGAGDICSPPRPRVQVRTEIPSEIGKKRKVSETEEPEAGTSEDTRDSEQPSTLMVRPFTITLKMGEYEVISELGGDGEVAKSVGHGDLDTSTQLEEGSLETTGQASVSTSNEGTNDQKKRKVNEGAGPSSAGSQPHIFKRPLDVDQLIRRWRAGKERVSVRFGKLPARMQEDVFPKVIVEKLDDFKLPGELRRRRLETIEEVTESDTSSIPTESPRSSVITSDEADTSAEESVLEEEGKRIVREEEGKQIVQEEEVLVITTDTESEIETTISEISTDTDVETVTHSQGVQDDSSDIETDSIETAQECINEEEEENRG